MTRYRSLHVFVCAGHLALVLPALAAGQAASLLVDLNTTTYYDEPGRNAGIGDLKAAGDKLFFVANGDRAGGEMWVSDGSSAGTEILRDLCPGPCDGEVSLLGGLGDVMLALAQPGQNPFQHQLWRSDGTRPGTFVLTPPELIVQARTSADHSLWAFAGRSLYFVGCAYSGEGERQGCNLWRSNGTAAGTRFFRKVPNPVRWLLAAGDRLFYLTTDGQSSELWGTDGTAAGTVRLHRFETSFRPYAPAAVGSRLFFLARKEGEEVWTSDGTVAGTRALTAFPDDQPFGYADWLLSAGNRVYFVADDGQHGREIWQSDGTAAGTVRVTEIANDTPFSDDQPTFLAAAGDTVVFTATDGLVQSPRLWATSGTPESTAPLEISCGSCTLASGPAAAAGKILFLVEEGSGLELWTTDGTAAGTRRARELCAGSCSSNGPFVPWKNGVLIPLETYDRERGTALWWSDGTSAGTRPFVDPAGANPTIPVAEVGGAAYFYAWGDIQGLWVRDAAGATRPVRTFPRNGPGSAPRHLAAIGDRLVFTAGDGSGFDLWSSDGTAEGTLPFHLSDVDWNDATGMVPAAGLQFFQVGYIFSENELWRTDGTPQGTFKIADLQRQAALAPYRGALYFFDSGGIWKTDGTVGGTARVGTLPAALETVEVAATGPNGIYLKTVTIPYGTEFWFTNGTGPGTHPITDLRLLGVSGADPEFAAFGPHEYFSWGGLWRSDGTLGGTTQLAALPPGLSPTKLVAHQGALYFFTRGATFEGGLLLWRTDGTVPGTVQLGRFPGQDTYDFPVKLTPFAGKLFFNVDDGVHGIELWATDGTPAGTGLVRDLYPGPRSSKPNGLTVAGGRLFFAAGDDVHGIELWQSDGTAAGTRLVHDIGPQAVSSAPQELTVVGDTLYFTADDGITGREVWKLPLSASATCRPSSTRFCLSGGRYAVEAVWRDFQGGRGVGRAVSLTADTGYFWFFDPANVEVILKVLDGRGLNGHGWVFYGALSSVEYILTVTDTATGLTHRYINPIGQLASVADTSAFGPLGASAGQTVATTVSLPSPLVLAERRTAPAATGACAPSSARLCLGDGRFAVEIAWKDFQGNTGNGRAVELTRDTGWFWFFDPANVEVVLKVLDGRGLNGHHWVFYGALSSVEYTVTVTDTQTGEINTYRNPSGRLASMADTAAF